MLKLVVLVAAVLALTACGEGEGGDGGAPPTPVSGSGSAPAAAVARVDGTVRDGAGRPVAGALVVPRATDPDTPGVPEIAVTSDATGRFSWPLRPGSYEVSAQLGERRSPPVAVAVRAGARLPSVELVLPD